MRRRVGTGIVATLGAIGLLAAAHLTAAQQRSRPEMGGPQRPGFGRFGPGPDFDRMDANSDGKVTKQEVADWFWQRFGRADANDDGAVTRDEMQASRPERPEGRPDRMGRRGFPGGDRRGSRAESFESPPQAKSDAEKKILDVLEDMRSNQSRGMMNVPREDGRLLRVLAETIGAKHVVEIGTSNGYSGIWLCLALRKTDGKLITYEINERRAELARQNFKRAGVDTLVTLVEGNAHEEVPKLKDPIDLLFLDADKQGYIDYLEKLLPLVRPGGLIVAHNMNPRQADPDYLEAITTNPDLETLFLHMQGSGMGVTMKKR